MAVVVARGPAENAMLIRMVAAVAVLIPFMLYGMYYTDVKRHGVFTVRYQSRYHASFSKCLHIPSSFTSHP